MDYRLTLLSALLAGALAAPTTQRTTEAAISSCSSSCTGSSKFNYAPGYVYQYKYEGETRTSMLGASEDHSLIGITAMIDVEILSKCEHVLQVHDVTISAHDSRRYTNQDLNGQFAATLEKFPLRYSFQDGQIESVCPQEGEQPWAINIKKGILSSLQNSMDSFEIKYKGTENDVTGSCDTEYEVAQRGWKSLSIKKSKDLTTCSHRQGFDSAIQTTPFRVSSGLKSLPIMKSTHTCDQEISTSGTLTRSVCHEMHVLRPFSSDNSGATTEVTQTISFIQEKRGTKYDQAECGAGEELYFEHGPSNIATDLGAGEAIDILRDLCDTKATEVTPLTSRKFSELVSTMKRVDITGLRRVYNQIMRDRFCAGDQEHVKKFYIDAIPMVGTDASIELMKMLISNSDIIGSQADIWLASVAFIHHPTKQMIQYVQELTRLPSLSTKVLLPLSVMVQTYCRVNPLCGEVKEVTDFIDILQKNIGGGCSVDQRNFRSVMMSLRALGNTGNAETAIPALYDCISNRDNSMDIKIAAVEAFRHLPCSADRNNLLLIYRDTTQDSELRIAAYLAVMKCPTEYTISQIVETLNTEQANQVGSFVWTHLTNLMESSDPSHRDVQRLLDAVTLEKEFDLDKMKFSRNYEGSFYFEKYNTGAKVDSNLIWSPKSFVPRSASLNLTLNLFGESLNLLEVGGRVEGLETLLEAYFGPLGYFNDETKGSNEIPDADPRSARLSAKKFKDIKKQSQRTMDQLRGAIFTRMFGSEISYNMFGANNGIVQDFSSSDMLNFLQKLRNNEAQKLDLTKNFMFLDSTYTVPTVVGLPLNLAINGSASMALNVGGQVNLKNPKSSVVIEGNFEPSAAVEIDSMMSVDAVVTSAGLKMSSTLYTSTGAQGKIEITDRNVFDLSFDITKEKNEVLDVKSAFFMVYNGVEKEQKMLQERREDMSSCTGDRLTRAAGIQFCASYSAPNASGVPGAPYFPFTGPVSLSVSMFKQDLPNGYKLEVKTIEAPVQTLFRFMSDTPGSKYDRAIGLDVVVQHDDRKLDITLTSPWKKAAFTGQLTDTASVKGLTGNLDVDSGARVYNLDAKILIDKTKDRTTFTPQITLEIPDWKNLQLSGGINYVRMESLDADLLITGAQDVPIKIQGLLSNTDSLIGVKGKVSLTEGEGYVFEAFTNQKTEQKKQRSRYIYDPRVYIRTPEEELLEFSGNAVLITDKSFKATGSLEKLTKIPYKFNMDLSKIEIAKKNRVRYLGRLNVNGPRLASKLIVSHDNRAEKNIFSKLRWDYNFGNGWKDTIVANSRIKMNLLKYKKNVKVTANLNSMKSNRMDAALSVNYMNNRYKTDMTANLKYGENMAQKGTKDTVDLAVSAKHRDERSIEYTVDFKFPAKNVDVKITGENEYQDKSLSSQVTLQYHPERTVSFIVHLNNRTDLYPNYAGELTIKLPQERQMSFAAGFGKENDNKYVSNLEFEIIKGRRTRLDTMLKIATEKMYEFEVGVQLPDLDPVRIRGAYTKVDNGHGIEASFAKADDLYKLYTQGTYEEGKSGKFIFDVTVPSRRVYVALGASIFQTTRHGLIDIQWDADRNLDSRFLTNITSDFKSWDDFELASMFHYPSRTVTFNLKHSAAARYITNVKLSWSPTEAMEFSIIFRDDVFKGVDRTELTVEFTSPFKRIEELGLTVSLIRDSAQFQTKSSVTWGKKKKVLVTGTARLPIEADSIDIVGTITTPFEDYEMMTASIKHRLSDEIMSNMLVEWGRERLAVTVTGKKQFTRTSRSLTGKLDIRTPFEGLRVLIVNAEHNDDFRQFSSKIIAETTKYTSQVGSDLYTGEFDMTHDLTTLLFSNTGTFTVTMPNDKITTVWELSNQLGKSRAMIDIMPMRNNRFKVDFSESHQMAPSRKISSKFELLIPTQMIRELTVNFEHEDKPGFVKTSGSVIKDNLDIMSADISYLNGIGSLNIDSTIKSAYTEDVILKLVHSHGIMPYTGRFELKWGETPYKITADSSINYNEFGMFDHSLKVMSPIPNMNMVSIKSSRKRRGADWNVLNEVKVDRHRVSLQTDFRFDFVKFTKVTLKSSFPQFPGLETSFNVDGTLTNFKGDAAFQMRPYVYPMSADFNLAYYPGTTLTGAFNLNTSFPQYPYMKAKVDSNMLGMSRVTELQVEYLPTQIVKLRSNHRFTSLETLEGKIGITSPYTQNKEVLAGFTHIGNLQEFHTKAQITCDCFKNTVYVDSFFSSKDGINSTFDMQSPFRGYEKVRWILFHRGTLRDFSTKAEYETNGKKLSFENNFSMMDPIKFQITFLTPFAPVTRTHLQLSHTGTFPNCVSHGEVAYNENLITADFDLAHNLQTTRANAVVTTPFKHFENIRATITKTGDLNDFSAQAEYADEQVWHAFLNYQFNGQDLHTRSILKSPYLPDDVSFSLNHTGKPLDFTTVVSYVLGPAYKSTGEVRFLFNSPNLTASAKTVTNIDKETSVNAFALEHYYAQNEALDISTKLFGQIKDQSASMDFKFKFEKHLCEDAMKRYKTCRPSNYELLSYLVVETPYPDFKYNKFFMEQISRSNEEEKDMALQAKVTFETPTLEKFTMTSDQKVKKDMIKKTTTYTYGSEIITTLEMFNLGYYHSGVTTSMEGYEHAEINVWYSGSLFDSKQQQDLVDWSIDSSLIIFNSSKPFQLNISGNVDTSNNGINSIDNNLKVTYSSDQEITFDYFYKPGVTGIKLRSPFSGYESADLETSYSMRDEVFNWSFTADSSALSEPLKFTSSTPYTLNPPDMEAFYKFTSGFTNFTHLELHVHVKRSFLKVAWENENRELREILVEGPRWDMNSRPDGIDASSSLTIITPYDVLKDLKVNMEHKHWTAPIRAKETVLAQYNGKKYFDMEAEFGALNKFAGSISFREPQPMEYSLTTENEGESVSADLLLNWNKLDKDSNFRLEFGLADKGNQNREKKVFHVRIINPGRIVSFENTFDRTDDKLSGFGKISWDESNQQEMSYVYDFSRMSVRQATLYNSDLKIVVPSRAVELSGSYSDQGGQVIGTGTVLWDADTDRDKQVQVKVTLVPYSVRKMVEVNVRLPSLNKELTLGSELALNDGAAVLDGQTTLKYSPEEKKTVLLKYNIRQNDLESSASWSLDHVATSTHVELTGSMARKDTLTTGDVQLKYDGSSKDMTALALTGQLDTSSRQLDIKLTSPEESVELMGQLNSESPYMVTIATSKNRNPLWKTVWTVDTDRRTLDASMTYDDMKGQIVTKSFFPNTTSFMSETSTVALGDEVQEGRLAAELEDRKLHALIRWRPQLISEAATYGGEVLKQLSGEFGSVVENGMKDLGRLATDKHELISASLEEELKPVSSTFEEEIKDIQQDLRKMRRELKRMYRQNDLYLRTIEETYSGAIRSVLAGYSTAIAKLDTAYNKAQEMIEELSNKIDTYPLQERYNAMVNTVSEAIQEGEFMLTEELQTGFSLLVAKLEELSTLYDDTLADVSSYFQKMIEVLVNEFTLMPYLEELQGAFNQLVASAALSGPQKEEIRKVITQVQEILVDSMKKTTLIEKYKTLYQKTKNFVSQHVTDVMNNEDLREINQAVLDLYEQVSWIYKYTEMNLSLKELIEKIVSSIRSKVMEEFNQLPLGILDLHKSRIITFDLENGEVEFDLYLPIPMENFEEAMKFTVDKYINKLQKMVDKYFPRQDFSLWDFYYRLPPVQLAISRDLVPPFDVFGTVFGKQHFTTFDGHHYDVAGLCSYVLAQDLVDGNFSVVLKYTGGPRTLEKDSIVVMVAGKTVEMFQNYMLKVDGQPVEMPYRADKLMVMRSGDVVSLQSTVGLTVISDFSHDYHIVGLSGWYYGKVGGLLGNIDNDPTNDYMNPTGGFEDRTRKLLNSWEVDTSCKSTQEYQEDEPRRKFAECETVFNTSTSSLRPCFLMVDPAMYQHSCDMSVSDLCDIATLYTKTCERHGISVNIPDTCVTCKAHDDGEFTRGQTLRYEASSSQPVRNTMDVVFVVEERECNRDISRKLKDIVYRLDQALNQNGLSDNQYSLVGYAGSSVVSHTMEGQLFNDGTKFAMGLENLQYKNLGPYSDPLSAIMYASSLPFRTAVKKTVILVSCSPCEEASGYSYSSLSSELQSSDITLHVLRQNGFLLKNNRSPKSQIYGLDSKNLYTGQRRDDDEIFSSIDIPQDYCASLALRTNGSVYDSSHVLVDSVRNQQHFMENFGERVQQTDSPCQVCNCELDNNGTPYTVCRTCDSQEVYFKGVPELMQKAVEYKNLLVQKLKVILY